MTLIDSARHLAEKVGPVMPIRDKIPLWGGWPGRACRTIANEREWTDATGIGLTTGSKSGYFVIDIDRKSGGFESLTKLQNEHGQFPPTWRQETGGGGVQFFFHAPSFPVKNSRAKLAPGIDIRGEGGFVVSPPSRHPNGNLYRWAEGRSPWEVRLAHAPSWLIFRLRPVVIFRPVVNNIVHMDQGLVYRRARAYLARIPGAVSGNGGDSQTWSAALCVVRGFALDVSTAYSLLATEYNPRCDPPWSEEVLSYKIAYAFSNSILPFGYLLMSYQKRLTFLGSKDPGLGDPRILQKAGR